MTEDRPLIVVVPRHELPDDELVQLIDTHGQPYTLRVREDIPIDGIADVINELAARRARSKPVSVADLHDRLGNL